ncbi:MAG: glutamyl-tRNA reductase [Gammaproteobacteria bacterium]|nr:glutamyl-tRNA reductase [Gammaproteobacteria bacterium]
MSIIVFGVSHKTAPIDVREKVVFDDAQLGAALAGARTAVGAREAVILSTCNRTEFYLAGDGPPQGQLADWLVRFKALDPTLLDGHFYTLEGPQAIRHTLRVACGLDSMVLGEPQILGQLKQAYHASETEGSIGKTLSKLMQYAFTVAKKVRTETAIGQTPVSVAYAAVRLARQIHGDLKSKTALLIGAGDTISLVASHLRGQHIGRMIIANRTLARSEELARELDGEPIALTDVAQRLWEADVVVSSTASPLPIINRDAVEVAIRRRRYEQMFFVDLAVPRDIEPAVGELGDVYLYTVDDLNNVITENMELRQLAAAQAEEIVALHAQHFMDWLQSLDGNATIIAYRRQAEATRDELLDKAQRQLAAGGDPGEVLHALATTLVNKLVHHPTAKIREASVEGRTDLLLAARELLNIHGPGQ